MPNLKLRVCLTDKCNLSCNYCNPSGESNMTTSCSSIKNDELLVIISELINLGFEGIKLTGGEPLLRHNFFELARGIKSIKGISKLTMVTNGTLFDEERTKKIAEIGFKSIKVSLDSVNRYRYFEITNSDSLQKVLDCIKLMQKYGINVKINSVITRSNYNEVFEIINYCIQNNISIKLLDLVGYGTYYDNEYIAFDELTDKLINIATRSYIQYQDEGFGIPESVYDLGNIEVVVKDSTMGTCYTSHCNNCTFYPCQSGIVSFVLSHNGILKLCPMNSMFDIDLKPLLDGTRTVLDEVKKVVQIYESSKFTKFEMEGNKGF